MWFLFRVLSITEVYSRMLYINSLTFPKPSFLQGVFTSSPWAPCFPFQACVLADSSLEHSRKQCCHDCLRALCWSEGTAGRKPGSLDRILICWYILLLRLSALFPGAAVHHELLYPEDQFQVTQLALTNEEVVNWRRECRKAVCSLSTKLPAVNRRGFPLHSTGSVPAEVAFWKLLCTGKFPKGHITKQNSHGGKKDIPN